jgi:hypothetical protein
VFGVFQNNCNIASPGGRIALSCYVAIVVDQSEERIVSCPYKEMFV